MTEEVYEIKEAMRMLREEKKRKFVQTVDLIVNLHNYDVRKEALNTFLAVPHPSEKKICAFLTKKSSVVDTITENEFSKYKDKKEMKRLANEYDYFIAVAPMMSKIATKFGRVFGPMSKMPSPQGGIVTSEDDATVEAMMKKLESLIRVRNKEASIKLPIGKESMKDEELIENAEVLVKELEGKLPRGKENIKNVYIKFTMSKPINIIENRKK